MLAWYDVAYPQTSYNSRIDKLIWDDSKLSTFRDRIFSEINSFNTIVDKTVSSEIDINQGVNNFAELLYTTTFSICGITKQCGGVNNRTPRKYKSPWFTMECEIARRELKCANREYKKKKSAVLREKVILMRRKYCQEKRRARAKYNYNQKSFLHNTAERQPQKFWHEIRKLRGVNNPRSSLSAADFVDHFKELFSRDNIFVNDDIETELDNEDFNINSIEQLDCPFSVQEIEQAICCLKRGKSGGEDLLIPEIFIESRSLLSPALCRLFNFMFERAIYPESWTRGIIVPVPKKGNPNDVNNYRGITLTSVFSKIFSLLLDNRLRKWSENNNILTDFQFGFRKDKSTVDCIFVLSSLINKLLCDKSRVYCAFVDFRKAFDLVYRNGIWHKLIGSGVSTKMVLMLRAIYESVKSSVRVNGKLSDYFDTYMGVKQGEPLSPLLFIFFINDMSAALQNDGIDLISIEEMQIFLLLFADDTALFSHSPEGLQMLLNKLHAYCSKWGIEVNVDKTVTMTFKQGARPNASEFYYNDEKLKNVNKFTYLGVTLSSNGKFYQAQKSLSNQASKALFSLNSLFQKVSLNVSEKIKLFDAMILPILTYGSEIWGFHPAPDVERVHMKFLKQILGVRPQTSNVTIYGELGRMPLSIIRKERILKYWYKLIKSPESLIYKAFLNLKDDNSRVIGWAQEVNKLLNDLGFNYLWNNDNVTLLQLNKVIERLKDQYLQYFYSELNKCSKLITYNKIKKEFTREKYLDCVTNDKHRVALSRFRCSAHKLAIEEGRYRNIERNQRICSRCNINVIENEYHFLLVCPLYRDIRNETLPHYYCVWPSQQKFEKLLNSTQTSILKKIAKFIHFANLRRENFLNE